MPSPMQQSLRCRANDPALSVLVAFSLIGAYALCFCLIQWSASAADLVIANAQHWIAPFCRWTIRLQSTLGQPVFEKSYRSLCTCDAILSESRLPWTQLRPIEHLAYPVLDHAAEWYQSSPIYAGSLVADVPPLSDSGPDFEALYSDYQSLGVVLGEYEDILARIDNELDHLLADLKLVTTAAIEWQSCNTILPWDCWYRRTTTRARARHLYTRLRRMGGDLADVGSVQPTITERINAASLVRELLYNRTTQALHTLSMCTRTSDVEAVHRNRRLARDVVRNLLQLAFSEMMDTAVATLVSMLDGAMDRLCWRLRASMVICDNDRCDARDVSNLIAMVDLAAGDWKSTRRSSRHAAREQVIHWIFEKDGGACDTIDPIWRLAWHEQLFHLNSTSTEYADFTFAFDSDVQKLMAVSLDNLEISN
ncbi:hypothetical protein C1H76_8726 [Elsinoe australis]|uniref:Uncharacterized protein n=1 Tax=Elsinoe australis TaxID=40998 RepID=A0A4U7AM30_9PEZI|nr:hypothetical protein C1H76_8726 [Elsinoe australis]